MSVPVISTLSIAKTTVIAYVHSGNIKENMTATVTAIVQSTLTLTTTMPTVASSSPSRCNCSTATLTLPLHSKVAPATAATKTEDSEDFLDDTDAVKQIFLPSNKNK